MKSCLFTSRSYHNLQLYKNEEAEVIVHDSVFPGVYIEICHVSYIVSRKMDRFCFRLNKTKGKIIPVPLILS